MVTVIGVVPCPLVLVPVMVTVCAVDGAVKAPAAVMLPAEAVHVVMAWLAMHCAAPPIETLDGVQVTVGAGGGAGLIVMGAWPVTVGTTVDAALAMPLVAPDAGVKTPLEMAPLVADQMTVCGAAEGKTVAEQLDVPVEGMVLGAQFTLTLEGGGGGVVVCRNDVPV